jgi:Flp pilus assembly protein TadG
MTARHLHLRAKTSARRFWADESGANLVEFALVITLFLFLLFAIIDFGRIGHAWVGANKATQLAARLAAVRPPACTGLPLMNLRGSASPAPNFGTLCQAASGVCAAPQPVTCQGTAANATAQEIYTAIRPLLPAGMTIDQMSFSYAADPSLGFLGGPFVPMVTVELTSVTFRFVSPLGPFITALTGAPSTLGSEITMPGMSVSLPGEDLALGMDG